jgi:hypothetical protein
MPRSPHGMPLARLWRRSVIEGAPSRRPWIRSWAPPARFHVSFSFVRAGAAVAQWRGMVPGRGLAPGVWTVA